MTVHGHGHTPDMESPAQAPAGPGRRLQHLKLVVVVPLTVLGLVLGAALLQHSGELTPTAEEVPAPVALALSAAGGAPAAQLKAAAGGDGGGAARKPTMQEVMQAKVKECARNITGDDTPRKLAPEVRAKVLDCASDVMPAMDTNALLKASADKLRAAAKDAGDEQDAEKVIAAVAAHDADAGRSPASSAAGGAGGGASAASAAGGAGGAGAASPTSKAVAAPSAPKKR